MPNDELISRLPFLPGLESSIRTLLTDYNWILAGLGQPGYELVRMPDKTAGIPTVQQLRERYAKPPAPEVAPEPAEDPEPEKPARKRVMTEAMKERLRKSTKRRWALAKKSGKNSL